MSCADWVLCQRWQRLLLSRWWRRSSFCQETGWPGHWGCLRFTGGGEWRRESAAKTQRKYGLPIHRAVSIHHRWSPTSTLHMIILLYYLLTVTGMHLKTFWVVKKTILVLGICCHLTSFSCFCFFGCYTYRGSGPRIHSPNLAGFDSSIWWFFLDERKCQFNDKSSNTHEKNCQLSLFISIYIWFLSMSDVDLI